MWTIRDPKALVQLLISQGCKPVFTLTRAPDGGPPGVHVFGTFAMVAPDVDPSLGVFGSDAINATPYLVGLAMGACCVRRLDMWKAGAWAELGFEGEPPAWVTWTPMLAAAQEHDA
jgi:hypothetical protein